MVQGGQVKALTYVEQQAAAALMAAGKVATTVPPLRLGEGQSEDGGAASIVHLLPLPQQRPTPVTTDTRPIFAAGTVPESPPPGSRIRAIGRLLLGGLAVVPRKLDGLLGRLVGAENKILHNFLRVAIAALLIAGSMLGWSIYREQRAESTRQLAAAELQRKAEEDAAQREPRRTPREKAPRNWPNGIAKKRKPRGKNARRRPQRRRPSKTLRRRPKRTPRRSTSTLRGLRLHDGAIKSGRRIPSCAARKKVGG